MNRLLYIGNKLSASGSAPTAIEILGPELESAGFAVTYASSRPNKLVRLSDMLYKTATASVDFVLIDTYSTWNFWYAFLVSQICRLRSIRYIPILHGGNLPHRLQKNPVLCKMLFGHAHINVAPSGYLKSAFSKFRVVEIANPVVLDGFEFKQRNDIAPNLLWVRSLAPIYNPEMAIRCAAVLMAKYPKTKLFMVGPDKHAMASGLQSLADELNVNVEFAGKLTKTQWAQASSQYDIFLNTSTTDNTPFSLIEAMALGLFVVSTNVGGIPFLIEDRKSGMLVECGDSSQMAAAIDQLLTNSSLRNEISSGAKSVVNSCNRESVLASWREILVI